MAHAVAAGPLLPEIDRQQGQGKEVAFRGEVDALKLSRASGIPIEKLAGESFDESGREPRRGTGPAKQ